MNYVIAKGTVGATNTGLLSVHNSHCSGCGDNNVVEHHDRIAAGEKIQQNQKSNSDSGLSSDVAGLSPSAGALLLRSAVRGK